MQRVGGSMLHRTNETGREEQRVGSSHCFWKDFGKTQPVDQGTKQDLLKKAEDAWKAEDRLPDGGNRGMYGFFASVGSGLWGMEETARKGAPAPIVDKSTWALDCAMLKNAAEKWRPVIETCRVQYEKKKQEGRAHLESIFKNSNYVWLRLVWRLQR